MNRKGNFKNSLPFESDSLIPMLALKEIPGILPSSQEIYE